MINMINPINPPNKEEEFSLLLSEMKRIGIDKLPYSYSAIEPFIDKKTMNIHYNKHYKGYVKKLNDLISGKETKNLENIIRTISKYSKPVRNNAGGAFNHALFWKMLTPSKKNIPSKLEDELIKNFESVKQFKDKFETIAEKSFGAGWVWLFVTKSKKLRIAFTPNQDNPLMNIIKYGGYPILGLDLWEHSYYLKYQNEKKKYIQNFWNHVNWDFVSELHEKATA